MKKLFILIMSLIIMPAAIASQTANVRININSPAHDNRYFLCLPNVGCLSIFMAKRGKVYPVLHPIAMSGIYVTDASNRLLVSPQGLPQSCKVTVNQSQTITISGSIQKSANNSVRISQLHCSVT